MAELDLLEQTRRDAVYIRINEIIDQLQNLDVFPSLVWVYVWDIAKDKLDDYSPEAEQDYITNPKYTEKDVWDMFWEDADKNAFSLEYGTENIHDGIFEWMIERDIIILNEEVVE